MYEPKIIAIISSRLTFIYATAVVSLAENNNVNVW